jgi:hypothetical protein
MVWSEADILSPVPQSRFVIASTTEGDGASKFGMLRTWIYVPAVA